MVFSKVGAAESFAILSTSARFSLIAADNAGLKRLTCTLSNGGTPPYGPSHWASSGFGSAISGSAGVSPSLSILDSGLREFSFMAFAPAVFRLSAMTRAIIAVAKSSKELRVINARITWIVLCLEVHDREIETVAPSILAATSGCTARVAKRPEMTLKRPQSRFKITTASTRSDEYASRAAQPGP